MPIYAVRYFYSATPEQLDAIRPIHREWVGQQFELGKVLASGRMADTASALLIFNYESPAALAKLLDLDPFDIAGFIGERLIEEWNPIFGPWK